VSYSRHDEALVKPLAGLLGAAADDAVFVDVTSIQPGSLWKGEIENAIRDSPVFVLCWCCNSAASEFIQHEIDMALKGGEKRLVPVLFCSTPLPPLLASRQWIDLRGRVVHACNHATTEEDNLEHTGAFLPYNERRHPPPTRSSPRSKWIWISTALAFVLTFLIGVFSFRKSYDFPHPIPSAEKSTLCFFQNGPKAGEALDLAPQPPLAIGSPCQDGAGNTGVIVERMPAVWPPENMREQGGGTHLVMILFATLLLVVGLFLPWRKRRRREADKIAAAATTYFEELGKSQG